MHVLITGGAGFLGRRLAEAWLARDVGALTLVDVNAPSQPLTDRRVRYVTADLAADGVLESVIDRDTTAVFHLAAVVSGQAEADFDLGMRVNVDATRRLLEVCRARGHAPRFVFTSSVAVYGGALPEVVRDDTALAPQTSYGVEKAIGEMLVSDYSRRGFVDGRILRLPTVSVRPGRPNAALSSFASGIIREPLNGEDAICPVGPDVRVWLTSPDTVTAGLVHAHDLPAAALGDERRINLPGLSVTVGEMVASLARVAGDDVASRVQFQIDPRIDRIVRAWPGRLDNSRALGLRFPADSDFDAIVRQHVDRNRSKAFTT